MLKQKQNNKIVVGLTGSFGSGKSTVASIFASYGAVVIDADKIAHACIRRGSYAYKKIISVFGTTVIDKNKEINRRKLGKIVFDNRKLLERLNKIVHPEVIRVIKFKIKNIKKGVIVLDAPLLIEAGLRYLVDKLVVVTLEREAQISRLLKKKFLSEQDIIRRIKFQIPLAAKKRLADFIIDNNGSLTKTKKQVKIIMGKSGGKLWKS